MTLGNKVESIVLQGEMRKNINLHFLRLGKQLLREII